MVDVGFAYQHLLTTQLSFADWLAGLGRRFTPAESACLELAWQQAATVYGQQVHKSGVPWQQHTQAVAALLVEWPVDVNTIAAGLLYGWALQEDFDPALAAEQHGQDVADLITGFAKIIAASQFHNQSSQEKSARPEALRSLILALASDLRVVFVALAVRLIELRCLDDFPEAIQKPLAQQTLDIHASLANRLGLSRLKWELQDLSLRTLRPDEYRAIAKQLAGRRQDRERTIKAFTQIIEGTLAKAGIPAQVSGRPKHIYSIWKKMHNKHLAFDELFDVRAFRVLVDTVDQCYQAYAALREIWTPIVDEYTDYIVAPKANNYQSLHMVANGPDGRSLEVQFRTRAMNDHAELGSAAHWRYKEGGGQDKAMEAKVAWLRELLHWAHSDTGPYAIKGHDKPFEDQVYVFTPQGDVMALPPKSTPVEFAYRVHTQVGHHCRGATVNGHMVPLSYQLQTGDHVVILTGKNVEPRRDWLNPSAGYLVSQRTRSKVQRWFRARDYKRHIADGRAILERELHRLGYKKPFKLERLAQISRFKQLDDFLEAIGRGEMTPAQITSLVAQHDGRVAAATAAAPQYKARRSIPADAIIIDGQQGLSTRLAGCCSPTPQDAIVGYITRNNGISIHCKNCINIIQLDETARSRLLQATWGQALNTNARP